MEILADQLVQGDVFTTQGVDGVRVVLAPPEMRGPMLHVMTSEGGNTADVAELSPGRPVTVVGRHRVVPVEELHEDHYVLGFGGDHYTEQRACDDCGGVESWVVHFEENKYSLSVQSGGELVVNLCGCAETECGCTGPDPMPPGVRNTLEFEKVANEGLDIAQAERAVQRESRSGA